MFVKQATTTEIQCKKRKEIAHWLPTKRKRKWTFFPISLPCFFHSHFIVGRYFLFREKMTLNQNSSIFFISFVFFSFQIVWTDLFVFMFNTKFFKTTESTFLVVRSSCNIENLWNESETRNQQKKSGWWLYHIYEENFIPGQQQQQQVRKNNMDH